MSGVTYQRLAAVWPYQQLGQSCESYDRRSTGQSYDHAVHFFRLQSKFRGEREAEVSLCNISSCKNLVDPLFISSTRNVAPSSWEEVFARSLVKKNNCDSFKDERDGNRRHDCSSWSDLQGLPYTCYFFIRSEFAHLDFPY